MKDGLHIDKDGTKRWYLNDEFHRVDGPAVIHINGTKFWFNSGLLHNKSGPAIMYKDGSESYYLHGTHLTQTDWLNQIQLENLESLL